MSFRDFLQGFSTLLSRYLVYGWPFFIAHLAVLYALVRHTYFRRLRPELRALGAINPEAIKAEVLAGRRSSPEESQPAVAMQLILFMEQAELWARSGVAIPLTDFSDRMDSIIDGIVDELHSRVNLFLIVGIAGTFFGLFEFAVAATPALRSGGPETLSILSSELTRALSNAFPVGFVGLVATLVGHLVVSSDEEKLRGAAARATQRCLHARTIGGVGERISEAIAPLVSLEEKLVQALKPVENLQDTLGRTLEPVITKFGEQLDGNKRLVEEQLSSLKSSVEQMQTAIASAARVLEEVPQQVKAIADVAAEARKDITRASETIEKLEAASAAAVASASTVVGQLENLPELAKEGFTTAFGKVGEDAAAHWRSVTQGLIVDLEGILRAPIGEMARHTKDIEAHLASASANLYSVAANANLVLEKAISEAVPRIEEPLRRLSDAAKRDFPEAAEKISRILSESMQVMQDAEKIAREMNESTKTVAATTQAWKALDQQLAATSERLKTLGLTREEMENLRQLIQVAAADTSKKDMMTTLQQLHTAASDAASTVKQIQRKIGSLRQVFFVKDSRN